MRIDNDPNTPDEIQPYSGLTSQNVQQRNLMKTHATSFYKPNNEKYESFGTERDSQPTPLLWDESKKNYTAFDDTDMSDLKIDKLKYPSMIAQTEEEFRTHMRKTMQHKHFGGFPKMKHLPKKFSPRKDVVYLFEEETKVDAMKRKLYERKPFETRFTAKLQNYAKDINDNLKIQDNLMKYIEKKHDISNALFESSKLSRANYSKT